MFKVCVFLKVLKWLLSNTINFKTAEFLLVFLDLLSLEIPKLWAWYAADLLLVKYPFQL